MSLTDFKVLSFDCYGTLINWTAGILTALQPLLVQLPADHPFAQNPEMMNERLEELERELMRSQPHLPYNSVLSTCHKTIADENGLSATDDDHALFGNSVGTWEAWPDTVAGLKILKKYYRLVILSNVDNENIRKTVAGPLAGVGFDAVYTAENIGSYKPSQKNFEYLFDHVNSELGIKKDELLHTAKSLTADHVPAKQLGLTSVWIDRGGSLGSFKDKVDFSWRFGTIGAMAAEVEKAFADGS
jgi:2-haloalkanoic acid dehalogenase type II